MNRFLMDEVEMPLVEVVADIEDAGYPVDADLFRRLAERVGDELRRVADEINKLAGTQFNPGSTPQVQELLFRKLGLECFGRTETGAPSTDDETLRRHSASHPVVPLLLRHRLLGKVRSTYCTIPDRLSADGRWRVEFNQLEAQTGRIASKSVIQQLPKGDEFGIREAFRATPGHKLVGADFSQQELFILAQVSGDRNMTAAIERGIDLHGLAAVKVFHLGCEPNEVERLHPDKRSQIKAVQFGLVYGSTAYGLAPKIGGTKEQAEQLIRDYYAQFPAVDRLIKTVHADAARDGYVDDVFGRRRYFPYATRTPPRKRWSQMSEAEKELANKVGAAKRAAQNFVIQGAAATVTKLAMVRCHRHIRANRPGVRMILTLHDELHFEVPDGEVAAFAAELPALMCDLGLERFGFKVPFRVDVKVGDTWGTMVKWKGSRDGGQVEDREFPRAHQHRPSSDDGEPGGGGGAGRRRRRAQPADRVPVGHAPRPVHADGPQAARPGGPHDAGRAARRDRGRPQRRPRGQAGVGDPGR